MVLVVYGSGLEGTHTALWHDMHVQVRDILREPILSFYHVGPGMDLRLWGLVAGVFAC